MRSFALGLAFAIGALTMVLATPSFADKPPVDPEVAKHFGLANDLYGEQKYGDALVEYDAAYDRSHNWKILYNRGQCLVMLKREPEAIESLQRYLVDGAADVPDDRRKQVETDLEKLKDRLGGIIIAGAPDGTLIEVDGRVVATIPLSRPIQAGAGVHEVTARPLGGGIPSIKKVTVIRKEVVTLTVDLAVPVANPGTPAVPPAGTGTTVDAALPPPPPIARTTTGLVAPSFMITVGIGGSAPLNDTASASNNRVLGGADIGASWRINSFWELGLYGAFAGGKYALGTSDGKDSNISYTYGTYGLRFRIHPVRGRVFDGWLGFDVGRFTETWDTTTTVKTSGTALGLGFGVDFPLGRSWALGTGLRFLAASKPECANNDCGGLALPETRGFVEFGLRVVWSIPYGQPKPAVAPATNTGSLGASTVAGPR